MLESEPIVIHSVVTHCKVLVPRRGALQGLSSSMRTHKWSALRAKTKLQFRTRNPAVKTVLLSQATP